MTYHEEIRKSTETDEWYKFSYFKDTNGYFVQIGYSLENYLIKTLNSDVQTICDDVVKDSGIHYVLVTDKNLISIADSDIEDIGIDWSNDTDYQAALSGKNQVFEWYYPKIERNVLEVALPLYLNNSIIGVIGVGTNMDAIDSLINIQLSRISVLMVLILIILLVTFRQTIYNPIQNFGSKISDFDLKNLTQNKIPLNPNDPFMGLAETYNSLIASIGEQLSIIEQKNQEAIFASTHDLTTSLPNRRALNDFIRSLPLKTEMIAFCMLEMNGLKDINDVYGHDTGDFIIATTASRLSQFADKLDCFRFGGDEFFLLIRQSESELIKILSDVLESLSTPVEVNNELLEIEFCVGI